MGVVIRNENGLIMGAMSRKLPIPLRATEVEANALEEGIQLVWDLGFRDIDLESDALVVVGAVVGYDPGLCSIQKVVEGTKLWLKAFRSWSCAHVRRQSNMAAHLMANVIVKQIQLDVNVVDSCPNLDKRDRVERPPIGTRAS